jgi:hypothetical protein
MVSSSMPKQLALHTAVRLLKRWHGRKALQTSY